MSDIFLCYSRVDSQFASRLEQRLRAEGWSVYRDVQIHIGKRWPKEIEHELRTARAVVVLWSGISRDSDYVLEEAEYARRKEILFPAFIEPVESPYGFGRIQTAELMGWTGEENHPGLAQLLESLREHLGGSASVPETTLAGAHGRGSASRQWSTGQTFRDKLKCGGEGPSMVVIPAGRFNMGSPPEEPERFDREGPRHETVIPSPFAMSAYLVTFDDYDRYCETARLEPPSDEDWGRGNRPVIHVSWNDAQGYCTWLSEQTGCRYRLPSEAEWEYACRAGTDTPFHFGKRLSSDLANFDGTGTYNGSAKGRYRAKTTPVGSFPPNPFGLYDMHGNVWEWCQDSCPWNGDYQGAPSDGSAWEAGNGTPRVLRGGSWLNLPKYCRSAFRYYEPPDDRFSAFGFRVCRAPVHH